MAKNIDYTDIGKAFAKLPQIPKTTQHHELKIGWFSGATYPNGQPVVVVAFFLEFGTYSKTGTPLIHERRVLRDNYQYMQHEIVDYCKRYKRSFLDKQDIRRIGQIGANGVQRSIRDKGMVVTGRLLGNVTYRVI